MADLTPDQGLLVRYCEHLWMSARLALNAVDYHSLNTTGFLAMEQLKEWVRMCSKEGKGKGDK